MKKLLLASFFSLFLCLPVFGQTWTRLQGWGLDLESIHWVNDQKVFAVGENLIIYSENAGSNWIEIEQKFDARFNDITFVGESIGLTVGQNGEIFRSIDGGLSWKPMASGTTKSLKSILATGENNVYAAGEDGTLIFSSNAGIDWTSINTNSDLDFQDIFFTNENTGYLAGQAGHILRSVNKGVSWQKIKLNTQENLNGISFTSVQVGYAVGDKGVFFRTSDGGNTWITLRSNVTTRLKNVVASPLDSRIIVASGEQATLIRTANSGTSFTKINLGTGNTLSINGLGFRQKTNVLYSVGQSGYVIFSNNAGANWTMRMVGIRNDFSSVDFKTNTIGYLAGKNGSVYATTNGAVALTLRPLPEPLEITKTEFSNNTTGFASSVSGKIFRTTNSGSTWIPIPIPTSNKIQGFHLFSASSLFVVGTNGFMARTTNTGTNWDQSIVSNTQSDLRDVSFFDANNGFAVGINGQISKTTGGSLWESLPKITNEHLNASAILDTTTAIVVGDNGILLKTTNKAKTWEILPFPEKVNLTSVDFWDKNLGFIVGEKGLTFQTKDGGINWVKFKTGTVRDLLSVNYGDSRTAFAVGKDGSILSFLCTLPGSVSPITGNSTECLGPSVYSITSSPESNSEIVWRVDGGNILSGQGTSVVEIEWTKTGRNAVFVNRSNFCGIGEVSALEVLVNPKPNISSQISGEGSVCINSIYAYSVSGQTGITFTWTVTGGEIQSGQGTATVSVIWKNTGDQKISVLASDSCGESEPKTKSVRSSKAPDQPAEIQGEPIIALGESKYQTLAVPGLNYKWNISGGGKIKSGQGTSSISVLWEKEGNFELSVEAQNECNFGPKRILPITVSVITALEPNPIADDLIVFPNPSQGNVTLHSSSLDSFEFLQVINSFGQILYQSDILAGDTFHELSNLPRGLHIIKLTGRKGTTSKKILIK